MKNSKYVEQMDVRFLMWMSCLTGKNEKKCTEKNQHDMWNSCVGFMSEVRKKKETFCLRLKFYY